jgi:hypothetical protein
MNAPGPIIIVVGVCVLIASVLYKFRADKSWSSVSLPLAFGVMIIITGALYSTNMLSSLTSSKTLTPPNTFNNGTPSFELGPYYMPPWNNWVTQYQGDKTAKWIYSNATANTNQTNPDLSVYSFLDASNSAAAVDKNVNLDIIVDDARDDVFWNGTSLKSSIVRNTMHSTNLIYKSNTTNTLEIRMHNTGGPAGLLYSVIDTATGVPYMVSNAKTTFKKV